MAELHKLAIAAVGNKRLVDMFFTVLVENGATGEAQEEFLRSLIRQAAAREKEAEPTWAGDELGLLRRDIYQEKKRLELLKRERDECAKRVARCDEEYKIRSQQLEQLERELAELEHALATEQEKPGGPAGAPPSGD